MYIAKATQIRNWGRFTLQDINSQVLQKCSRDMNILTVRMEASRCACNVIQY